MGRAIMLQGTGSGVGKSLLTAGLCRALTRRGLRVRPFKPQNMSNNAAVTPEGGEIGRAQALQARACGVPPHTDMNPVLLKPQSETGVQVVLQGRVWATARAREYQGMKPRLMAPVLESFGRLRAASDVVVVEGAGSASEVNLRAGDIANMGFAEAAGVPVVLVGDIDRGGVIASLVGTACVLPEADRARVRGFVVNRMRGDLSLFAEGMAAVARHTGWEALGLVPHLPAARLLPAEDAADLMEREAPAGGEGRVRVCVPVLPFIANFDDLDPLAAEPGVELLLLRDGEPVPVDAALVVLPGSKSTIADLRALRELGWEADVLAHRRRGGRVLGLCGGFQMLGERIEDPDGIEGAAGGVDGLGLLRVRTVLGGEKRLTEVTGRCVAEGAAVRGYEMHLGRTEGADMARPLLELDGRAEGACSADGLVGGTYLHGLFGADGQREAWLRRLGTRGSGRSHEAEVEGALDALAEHLERHVDVDRLLAIAA